MSEIILRPYQQKFIDDVRHEFAHGIKHVVGVAPCGAGKTIMTGWMIRQSLQKGKRSIFFVPTIQLIRQNPKCGHVVIPTITLKGEEQCPICGSIIPPDVPIPKEDGEKNSTLPDIEICDGELKEVDEIIADDNGRIVDGNIKRAPKPPEEFLAVEKKKKYRSGWAAYKSLERAKSYEDCLHIAKVCGYKSGWAYYKWQERETELEQKNRLQSARLAC